MACNHPDCGEPLTKLDFTIGKDGSDLNREALAAIMALMVFTVFKVHNASRSAMRAICTLIIFTPTDGAKVVNSVLLCWKRLEKGEKRIESLCTVCHAHYIAY